MVGRNVQPLYFLTKILLYCMKGVSPMDCRFDITYHDFNPTVLFVSKSTMNRDSRYHDHDFTEITYILSGKGQYFVEGITYNIKAGDLII